MPEEGETRVERIVLQVDAPIGGLQDSKSGLNYAIERMEFLNSQLDTATRKWREFTAAASSASAFTAAPARPGQFSGFIGQQRLSDFRPGQPTGATPSQKVRLQVSPDQIDAFVGAGKIKLNIHADDIHAEIIGGKTKVVPGAPPAGGGGGTPGGGGGAAPTGGGSSGRIISRTYRNSEVATESFRLGRFNNDVETILYDKDGNEEGRRRREGIHTGARDEVQDDIFRRRAAISKEVMQGTMSEADGYNQLAIAIRKAVDARKDDLNALDKSRYESKAQTLETRGRITDTKDRRNVERMQMRQFKQAQDEKKREDLLRSQRVRAYLEEEAKTHKAAQLDRRTAAIAGTNNPDIQTQAEASYHLSMFNKFKDLATRASSYGFRKEAGKYGLEASKHDAARGAAMQRQTAARRQMEKDQMEQESRDNQAALLNRRAMELQRITANPTTPTLDRAARAKADAAYHEDMAQKAQDLSKRAAAGGDRKLAGGYAVEAGRHMVEYANSMRIANDETIKFNQSNRLIGKNMIDNLKHVTTWAASVGILYGGMRLLTRSMEENMEIGREQAILAQIYRGDAAAVSELTQRVLELAAVNGQSTRLAMKSATEFSRIYHNQRDVLLATNAALVGSNVSGMEAGRVTEFLSMMSQVYKLRASELSGVIGQLAYISQTYNVTNQDLVHGMEASAEAAKEAGLSYSETFGIIAGGVSATKQSGTAIGNTLKTLITQMANPEVQQKLRLGSGIEVTGGQNGLKEMPDILREIYVNYERMNNAERRSFLFNVGGRQNATRLAGMLDKFIEGQVKAINAQLNLNAAESENDKIMGSLKGQLGALIAEWDRFVLLQGKGPMTALTDIAGALKNLLGMMNAPGMRQLTTLIGGVGVALGARMLVSGFKLDFDKSGADGRKGGVVASTIRALKADAKAFSEVFDATAAAGVTRYNAVLSRLPAGMQAAMRGTQAMMASNKLLAASFVALTDVVLPLLAIWLALKGLNKLGDIATGAREHQMAADEYEIRGKSIEANHSRSDLIGMGRDVIADKNVPEARKKQIARDLAGAQLPNGTAAEISELEKQNALLIEQGKIQQLLAQLAKSRKEAEQQATRDKIAQKAALDQDLMLSKHDLKELQERRDFQVGQNKTPEFLQSLSFLGKYLGEDVPLEAWETWDEGIKRVKAHIEEVQQKLAELAKQKVSEFADDSYVNREIRTTSFGARTSAITSGISEQFGQLPAGDPLTQFYRRRAELMSRQETLNQLRNQLTERGAQEKYNLTSEQMFRITEQAQNEYTRNSAELIQYSRPDIEEQRRNAYRLQLTSRFARAEFSSYAVGGTEGEQMVNQYNEGEKSAKNYRETGHNTEALTLEISLIDSKIKAQEKILELNREEKNLIIAKTREYERGLLLSGPGDLLRKLAVNQLSKGGMNAGGFFAMGTEARQAFLELPENSQDLRLLRRSRNALKTRFGQDTAGTTDDVLGMAQNAGGLYGIGPQPGFSGPQDLAPNMELIQALGQTAAVLTGSGGVIEALTKFKDALHLGDKGVGFNPPIVAQFHGAGGTW